jgi:uncharacterized protein (DUF2062 family)
MTPIVGQLRQGATPEKLALTIALGLLLSTFPVLGATTILCGLAAFVFRLNQPLIQIVNYLAYPLQLALLIPFYRAGERLLGRDLVILDAPLVVKRFGADAGQFFKDFGMIALGGVLVWLIVAPPMIAAIYFTVRPLLRNLAVRIRPSTVGATAVSQSPRSQSAGL